MRMKGKTIFNASFDVFAETYHSVRPGYPAQVYADIKEVCGLDSTSRLLEIGAGSGIATVEIAKFGSKIVAIEPGSHLAAIAREQTKEYRNVEIREEAFEDFQSAERFDAISAFTSFHWLKGEDKYQRVLKLLKDAGNLVLVWNYFFQTNSPATVAVNRVYHELLSDVYPGQMGVHKVNEEVFSVLTRREQRVIQNPLFYPAFMRRYLVKYNYSAETYPKFLNTFPKVIAVAEERRAEFLQRISKTVAKYGKISVPVLTSLIICKRKDYFLQAVADSEKEER
jgi:protein-L-isoaspartate O-methyltransferase